MALSKTEVSELYVSIFGRASEGEGNKYWQGQSSMVAAANAMLASDPAKAYFGETLEDNQAFIEFIYENTLNKTIEDDPEGIKYWVDLLEGGASKGEIVSSLINAIQSYAPGAENYDENDLATVNAFNQFENRVEISNYMADTVYYTPDDYETSTAFNGDLVVTYDDTLLDSFKSSIDDMATEKEESTDDSLDGDNPFFHKSLVTNDDVAFYFLSDSLLFEAGIDSGESWMSLSTYTYTGNSFTQTSVGSNEIITINVSDLSVGATVSDPYGTYSLTSVDDFESNGSWNWNLYDMSASEYLYYMQQADTASITISYNGLKANEYYDLYNPTTNETLGKAYAYEEKLYIVEMEDGAYELSISDGSTTQSYYLGEIA